MWRNPVVNPDHPLVRELLGQPCMHSPSQNEPCTPPCITSSVTMVACISQ
uniref:Uncharacterized protein n=1 Tax=Nelumbo nucifera TaxID=4432 RepID=A0A822YG84_NELNU|nr:TPA_asm: hypothetical protein HUJ06_010422 [Nelumbo nucifera]